MKYLLVIGIFALLAIYSCKATDLVVGNSINAQLVWQQKLEHEPRLLQKVIKKIFYENKDQKIIKAIIAKDIDHSEAVCYITRGGTGSSFVELRFKSERGEKLNYEIEIYV